MNNLIFKLLCQCVSIKVKPSTSKQVLKLLAVQKATRATTEAVIAGYRELSGRPYSEYALLCYNVALPVTA